MKSARTSKFRKLYCCFAILSVLLNVGPLMGYGIKAACEADLVTQKVALVTTVFVVLILSAIAWLNKTTMRSRVWVILLGLYFCLDYMLTPLIIIACTQILDEWFINPAAKSFKNKLIINKEMDKRNEQN